MGNNREPAAVSESPLDVAVAGHILNERVVFPDRVLYPVLGSPAAYSSICLARLGRRVGVVTRLGRDFPLDLLKAFERAGVRRDGIRWGARSTNNELVYHRDGRKSIRYLSRAENIEYSDFPEAYRSTRLIYVCPMDREVRPQTIERLRSHGHCLVVDLGGFGGATSAEHPQNKDGAEVKEICPLFDIVKASSEDLEYILGAGRQQFVEVARQLQDWGAGAVVVTLGKDGAYVVKGQESKLLPAYLTDEASVLDQTGAGDCFSAGFLSEYVASGDPFGAAVYGNAVTSFVIERTGGASAERMPNQEEADRRAQELLVRQGIAPIR